MEKSLHKEHTSEYPHPRLPNRRSPEFEVGDLKRVLSSHVKGVSLVRKTFGRGVVVCLSEVFGFRRSWSDFATIPDVIPCFMVPYFYIFAQVLSHLHTIFVLVSICVCPIGVQVAVGSEANVTTTLPPSQRVSRRTRGTFRPPETRHTTNVSMCHHPRPRQE